MLKPAILFAADTRTRDDGAGRFRRFVPAVVPSFTEELVSFVLCQTPPRDAGAGFFILGRDALPRVRSAEHRRPYRGKNLDFINRGIKL